MRSHEEQQRDRIYDLEQENARLRGIIGCITCGGRGWVITEGTKRLLAYGLPPDDLGYDECSACEGSGRA